MLVESRGNERAKGRRIEWLCQASDGSDLTGTFVVLRLPTQKHERDVPGLPMTADELSNFKAVKPRHRHIEQHEAQARSGNRKLVDIAQAVVAGHALLPKHT
jgi:hypothetical protein